LNNSKKKNKIIIILIIFAIIIKIGLLIGIIKLEIKKKRGKK
jgi:hypothetical protein